MKRSAFMTVEVLISLVIISMGVLTITSALKTMHAASDKQLNYEGVAIALMSIKDSLNGIDFDKTKHSVGTMNGWKYTITAEQIAARRTYVYDESADVAGNKGPFELYLYKITLNLENENMKKRYIIYQTRVKKLIADITNDV